MGVPSSGATLEISLVADVARLTSRLKEVEQQIAALTARAGAGFNDLGKSSGQAATQLAAAAQKAATAAMGTATGVKAAGASAGLASYQMQNLSFQVNDVVTGLASGQAPMRVFAQQTGQFVQIAQQSEGGIRGFIRSLAGMAGAITVTSDAELAASAATTKAAADAVKSIADRAAATLVARQTQIALAQAELAGAETEDAASAAKSRLTKATRGVFDAAQKATVAQKALATANAEAAAAAEASAAATVTSLTGFGRLVLGLGAATVAVAVFTHGFGLFRSEADKASDRLDDLIDKLKKHTDETEANAEAQRRFSQTMDGVKQAILDVNKALDDLEDKAKSTAERERDAAENALRVANAHAAVAQALIDRAKAELEVQRVMAAAPGQRGEVSALGLPQAVGRLAGAQSELDQTRASIAALQTALERAQSFVTTEQAAADEATKIKRKYDDLIESTRQQYLGQHKVGDELARQIELLKKQEQLELDSLQRGKDPIEQFKQAVIGAEGLAKNLRSSAQGFGGFINGTWLHEFNQVYPQFKALSDEAKLAMRDNKQVAEGIIDHYARENAAFLKGFGATVTAANLYLAHILGAAGAKRVLEASPGTPVSHVVGSAALAANPWILRTGTVSALEAEVARRIGDSSSAVSQGAAAVEKVLDDLKTELQKQHDKLLDLIAKGLEVDKSLLEAGKPLSHMGGPDLEQLMGKLPDYGAELLDSLKQISDQAQVTGDALADAFGRPGEVLGSLLTDLAKYREEQERLSQEVASGTTTQENAEKALANLRDRNILSAIDGVKGLFKEHSAAYKAMDAVEKAFAIAQLARTIASIAPKIAAGAATMFSQLGVFAFPAVAAMIALMAGLGFGGGGGGGSTPAPTAEDLQKAQGTGTVLGDSTAKSESIANSLDLMAKNSTKGLDYSSAMVTSLRKIETGIGGLTAAIARQIQLAGGSFDTSQLGLGSSTKGLFDTAVGKAYLGGVGFAMGSLLVGLGPLGALVGVVATQIPVIGDIISGIGKLIFNTKTTVSLIDQGIEIAGASIQQMIDAGVQGLAYQTVQIKKKSTFLGVIPLGGSTKTKDVTSALDPEISRQFQLIVDNLYDSVVAAAKVLGLDVGDALKTFQVEIGKISFKDLTGDEIQQQLEAVFSKLGDQMAGFAVAGLEQFQKAGEGLFETLMRIAKDYLTVDAALKSIGMTFGSVGASSIAARESLIDLAGGLDAFVDQVNFFYDHFLTDTQKASFAQTQVDAAFQAMGVAVPSTVDGFRQLVQGLDLTTDAGQQMFEQLMQVAPAFYEAATAAAQLAQKQQELQVQLLQAQGKTDQATALQRSIQLAALDPSLQALQKQVWAAQDAAAHAAAAQELANKRTQIQIQLLQAQGKTEEALAKQRQQELDQLDPALRDIQKQLYAAQDVATAKQDLVDAYTRESGAMQQTIDKFTKFASDLRDFRNSLFTDASGPTSYNQALINLMKQSGLAAGGNEDALGGGLQDAAQSFLDIATANAGSLADVARARALVARQLDQAIGGAEGQASLAQQQLDSMHDQVSKLVDIDAHVLTVAEAIAKLNALLAPAPPPPAGGGSGGNPHGGHQRPPHDREPHERHVRDALDRIDRGVRAVATHTSRTARVIDRADRGGSLAFVTDPDTPIKVTS